MAFSEIATTCQTGTVSGTQKVTAAAVSTTVTIAVISSVYTPGISPNWNTTWWVTGKSTTQFVVNFGTPAPDDGTGVIDWDLTGL